MTFIKKLSTNRRRVGLEIALNGSSYFRTFEGKCLGLASQFTDEVTFSPTFQPGFFAIVSRFIRLLISGEPDHLQRL